jgi:ABC-type transport system substrate-binding protein
VLGLKEVWKKEGIDLDLVTVDGPVFNSQYYTRVHEDLALTFHTFGDVSLNTYAQSKFKSGATENTSFIDDPNVERAIQQIKTTTDPVKLKEFARFLWDFDTQGMWYIWIPADRSYTAFSPRTRNFVGRHNDGFTSSPGQIMMWVADAPHTAP